MSSEHSSYVAKPTRVGLLGCGTVGSVVARELFARDDIEVAAVAVREPSKGRPVSLGAGLLTTDALGVALDPAIDIIIEAIGGISPTIDFVSAALLSGKPVVTANKELLASPCGASVFAIADRACQPLLYEAAAGGGIPIVRALEASLRGDRILRIEGVLNGTTNYILDRMSTGTSFDDALSAAQSKGFAEADPVADLSGRDAAAKIALLASVAFGERFSIDDVEAQGIEDIDVESFAEAKARGKTIRLIASAIRRDGKTWLSVSPIEIPENHVFARVSAENNAVLIDAELAGQLLFSGAGAGGEPTASAILGDLSAVVASLGGPARRRSHSTGFVSSHRSRTTSH